MSAVLKQIQEVLGRHGGRRQGRQVRLRCPFCQHNCLDVALGETGRLIAHCLSPACADRKGNHLIKQLGLPVDVLAEADREALGSETFFGEITAAPSAPRASAATRDQIYRAWLAACPPDEQTRRFLARYGLNDEEIDKRGYGRWPVEDVLGRLPMTDPAVLKTVPGIIDPGNGKLDTALRDPRFAGVLIPVRNAEGQVVTLKVRLYQPDASGKMRSLSSAYCGGPEAEYAIHHPLDTQKSSRVHVVEGEIKADIVAALARVTVLGLPGVHGI